MLKTNKPWTRVLSTALALCMLLSLLPAAHALGEEKRPSSAKPQPRPRVMRTTP